VRKKKKGRRRFPHKENEGTKVGEGVFPLSVPSILCFLSRKKKKGRRRFSHKENEGTKVGEEVFPVGVVFSKNKTDI